MAKMKFRFPILRRESVGVRKLWRELTGGNMAEDRRPNIPASVAARLGTCYAVMGKQSGYPQRIFFCGTEEDALAITEPGEKVYRVRFEAVGEVRKVLDRDIEAFEFKREAYE
jgi:hypothetical protein